MYPVQCRFRWRPNGRSRAIVGRGDYGSQAIDDVAAATINEKKIDIIILFKKDLV